MVSVFATAEKISERRRCCHPDGEYPGKCRQSCCTAAGKISGIGGGRDQPRSVQPGISPRRIPGSTRKYGCVDILVNNAGISESTPFSEYTEETFDKVMDLNVKGVFNATKAASECMIARGKGVILSTSSMVSISGQASGFAYPASKFAINGLTISLGPGIRTQGYPGQRRGSGASRKRI